MKTTVLKTIPSEIEDIGYWNLPKRLDSCFLQAALSVSCRECGAINLYKTITIHCFIRLCKKCVQSRISRARMRLNAYEIGSIRLLHLVVGFPTKPEFHRQDKAHEEFVMQQFHREMKKFGLELKGLRIFDFQDRKDEYTHYHYALLPGHIDIRKLQFVRRIVEFKTKSKFIVKLIGYRSKKALFNYFAKRIAGLYGDSPNYFLLSDVMDLDTYYKNFYNIKGLVKISRRLSSNVVPFSFRCSDCYCTKATVRIEIIFPKIYTTFIEWFKYVRP